MAEQTVDKLWKGIIDEEMSAELRTMLMELNLIIEEAKEMDKQRDRMHEKEIKDAYGHGQNNGRSCLYGNPYAKLITSEEYYQQTFKK
jgi:hypothetical protein